MLENVWYDCYVYKIITNFGIDSDDLKDYIIATLLHIIETLPKLFKEKKDVMN